MHPLNRPQYQTDTSSYNTTCATLERLPAPGRPPPIPDTTATPGRCTGQHRPSIIIRYIRGCSGAPLSWIHARQCSISQTMPAAAGQRLPCADHWKALHPAHPLRGQRLHLYRVIPAGVSMLPTPSGWRSGTLHPAEQSSSRRRSGRRGTIGGFRRISFRAFAR